MSNSQKKRTSSGDNWNKHSRTWEPVFEMETLINQSLFYLYKFVNRLHVSIVPGKRNFCASNLFIILICSSVRKTNQ